MPPKTSTPQSVPARPPPFDLQVFLDAGTIARPVLRYGRDEIIYAQGDAATDVLYIQSGTVKLSLVSTGGKQAVVALPRRGDFFGEGCLAGQRQRMGTASALDACTVFAVPKAQMVDLLHREPGLADRFLVHMLLRNIRIEQDLVDQLFNSTEKRLARVLLLLARYGQADERDGILPRISQQTLADIIGTTRARVNLFMNKFRELGLIDYDTTIRVHGALLSVVLHE